MLCSNTEIIWQEGVEKVPCSTILSQAINQFALIRIPLTLVCNRVRDVSHRDDSSDGYILGKWIMCQGAFANAPFAGKRQADRGWEGGRERRKTSSWQLGRQLCSPSSVDLASRLPGTIFLHIAKNCLKFYKNIESYISF